jgi:hypothetical protein
VTALTSGITYEFTVQARNEYGLSQPSTTITRLAAFKPDAPVTVQTENINDQVRISWAETVDNGSPITSFQVFVQSTNSGEFIQENVACDISQQAAIDSRECYLTL